MFGVDTFVHQENIKRYSAMLAGECDDARRATLQALMRAEEMALQEGEKKASLQLSDELRQSD